MDECCSAASREDDAANNPRISGTTGEDPDVPAEDTADGVGVFCCQDCGEAFREETAYLEHHYQHKQQNLDDQSSHLHGAQKDSETPYSCTLCSLSFVEMNELDLHMKNHAQISTKELDIVTPSGVTKQHTYICSDCGKSYAVIGHFLNHLRSHQKPSKSVFNDLEHLKKKSFQCESCGRSYSRASALDAHRRCHEEKLVKNKNRSSGDVVPTGELIVETKPSEIQTEDDSEKHFKCLCGKAFSTVLRLKTHQRFSRKGQCSPEEMKQKPKKGSNEFYCSECKKAFSGHVALLNHQRWHANHSKDSATRFPCEKCGKVFMTLTFFYRHQRTVHSDETPAKSFLHQVCQLQKKAFECKDCGLKFSRASALHSHQLQHTDVFRETEKETQMQSSLLSSSIVSETEQKESEHLEASAEETAHSESLLPTTVAVEESHVTETDEDMECYEPGDFNVQVISASESEDEPAEEINPDLELLCESDQDVKDDGDTLVSPSGFVSKPEIDLKIVQVDFEQTDEQCSLEVKEVENKTAEERFVCPECFRRFPSPSSLRVHRMWHGVHKRRQQTPGQSATVYTCDFCGHKASSFEAHYSHIQTHGDQTPSSDVLTQPEGLEKKTCNECGKVFSCLSALVSHQLDHPKRKQFQCPDCLMSYLNAAGLYNHMKICAEQKRENMSANKKEYNPKKTLLGPKNYHCEQCGKGFWSLGAYSHHKQNQTECTDLRLRKGVPGSVHSFTGHPRSGVKVACPVCGRKFRHKGIMALHMRKHENGNHKCELCNRSFRLFSSLLRHQVVHSDQLLPPPSKSFQHQVEQLKKNTYSCPDCGKLFSRAKALQFHMKSHGYETGHSPSSPRSTVVLEDLQCPTCFSHFNNKASLRAHQKLCIKRDDQAAVKTEPLENDLKMCKDAMDVSTQEHSDQLKLQTEFKHEVESDICKLKNNAEGNKTSSNFEVSLVKNPIKEEPSKGRFPCSECGRRFMTNSALGSHKRWHKERKFSRSFLKDDDLKSVSRKAEDGPFRCNKCGRQFFNHRVLQRHQIFNPECETKIEPDSNTNGDSSSTQEQVSSPECDKTFEQSSLLSSHVENEHRKIVEVADRRQDELLDIVQSHLDINCKTLSSPQKPKAHQCSLCFMTFAKVRGLRAHKWQAHSKSTSCKETLPLTVKVEPTVLNCETNETENSGTVKSSAAGCGRMKIRSGPPHVIPVSSLDCKKLSSAAATPLYYKGENPEMKHVSKGETQSPKGAAKVPSPLGRPSEHTVKCLFKCDKCGKAFQTEEQLGAHKTKAKSRPFFCALCCHSFWTGNQLQQHLAWHDQVRCRLPNELRFRLSAAMTSKPLKLNFPTADNAGKSFPPFTMDPLTLDLTSGSQSAHKCQRCGKAFLSPTALQKHKTQQCDDRRRDTPPAVSGNADGLTCLKCGTTFCQESDLHQHCTEHVCGV